MQQSLKLDRFLLFFTGFVLIGLFVIAAILSKGRLGVQTHIPLEGQPTIGSPNAPVQVVAFEEYLCGECRFVQTHVFPELKKEFIDTGKVRFTLIPLAYLSGSRNPFFVGYCLNKIYPNAFFPYIDFMAKLPIGKISGMSKMDIVGLFSKEVMPISYAKMQSCIESHEPIHALDRNLEIASKAMDDNVAVPMLFINGRMINSHNLKDLREAINRELKKSKELSDRSQESS